MSDPLVPSSSRARIIQLEQLAHGMAKTLLYVGKQLERLEEDAPLERARYLTTSHRRLSELCFIAHAEYLKTIE